MFALSLTNFGYTCIKYSIIIVTYKYLTFKKLKIMSVPKQSAG